MDEEQKSNIDPIAEISQRPKQKINVDSFFNRSADAESITAISLKLASVIEQIDVMRTEIKEIATYITVEHKIEKDLREDRICEEQDAKQKKEMKDRVLAKGEQAPKTAKGEAPQEESKGGGFFSGLMKIVGGLGLVAGLAALAPIILKVMGGLLITTVAVAIAKPLFNWVKGTFDKFKNFLDKTFKPVEKIPVVGKPLKNVLVGGLLGGLPGIAVAAATSISNALQGAGKGGGSIGGAGGGGPRAGGAVKESNLNLEENNSGKDMANTLEEKGVIKDTKDSIPSESFSEYRNRTGNIESDEEVESEKTDGVEELKQGNIPKTYRGVEVIGRNWDDIKKDMIEAKIAMEEIMQLQKRIFSGKLKNANERDAPSALINAYQEHLDEADRFLGTGKFDPEIRGIKTGTRLEIDETGKILNPEVIVPSFQFQNSNEDPNLSMNNTSVVVPKNEPQVSSAEIKGTGTTLAYVRSLQNPYLSITNKKIAPELSRIG